MHAPLTSLLHCQAAAGGANLNLKSPLALCQRGDTSRKVTTSTGPAEVLHMRGQHFWVAKVCSKPNCKCTVPRGATQNSFPCRYSRLHCFLSAVLFSCIPLPVRMKVRGEQFSTSWPKVQSSPHYTDVIKASNLKDSIHFPLTICARPQKSSQTLSYYFPNTFYSSWSLFQATLCVTCQGKCRWVFPDFKFKWMHISQAGRYKCSFVFGAFPSQNPMGLMWCTTTSGDQRYPGCQAASEV